MAKLVKSSRRKMTCWKQIGNTCHSLGHSIMSKFKVGMKVYDNDWFLKYGLGYQEAA